MAKFSELIKNFDKIRDYMRDFYVYGFKARGDFTQKSSRTYDNEKRRIESYLGSYIKWDTSKGGKRIFISLDSSKISQNPLYSAWKSKSFTDNDIMLHFYILDMLQRDKSLSCESITSSICDQSGVCFDAQTVRIKLNEYVKEGILLAVREGKILYYSLCTDYMYSLTSNPDHVLDAVKYFQGVAPFGMVGSYILDQESAVNDVFTFKHHFIVHTLEDQVLMDILEAMKENRRIQFINQSRRLGNTTTISGIPLKIFVSTQSGRRFLTIYNENRGRFINQRLDYIKSVSKLEVCEEYQELKMKLHRNLDCCWGVSFGGNKRGERFAMRLHIDELNEIFILKRLEREGRDGEIKRIEPNIYEYSKEIFDANEILHWVKSFTGRIISIECNNQYVVDKIRMDMRRMAKMYLGGDE